MAEPIPTGIELIALERGRQKSEEGYSTNHDVLNHSDQSLAWAATAYAAPEKVWKFTSFIPLGDEIVFEDVFPTRWSTQHDKRDTHPRIRQLVIAGALIAAEIDRIIAVNKLLETSDD